MFNYKQLLVLIVLSFTFNNVNAQATCGTVTISPTGPFYKPCDNAPLTYNFTGTSSLVLKETNTYLVNQIPYNPLPWGGTHFVPTNIDDCWSGIIKLPFKFCFFGQSYEYIVIGTNGQVSFDTINTQPPLVNGSNSWSITTPAPNNVKEFNNCILSPYQDIYPNNGLGSVTWDTVGVAPCRKMVINFTSVPMFSCTTLIDSQQVVLYEMSNIIDINIANKPLCTTWNSGVAHEGIQSPTGTIFMVPGRNGTQWTANNDSWSFVPNGNVYPLNTIYNWYNAGSNALLGTGPSFTLTNPIPDSIKCVTSIIAGCNSDTTRATNLIYFNSKINADFKYRLHLGCVNDTVKFFNTTFPQNGASYQWDFGDSYISTQKNPTHIYPIQGIYTVTLIVNKPPCIPDTVQYSFDTQHPLNAQFLTNDPNSHLDSTCLGLPLQFNAQGSLPNVPLLTFTNPYLNYSWDFGDGSLPRNMFDSINTTYIYPHAGLFDAVLTITDTLGCTKTSTHHIFIEDAPYVAFTASDSLVCAGDIIHFKDSVAPHTLSYIWDFGDGNTMLNIHNPSHTWAFAGAYNVTLTGKYKICPDMQIAKNIIIDDYPSINLGADTSICPGLTGAILLSNLNNSIGTNTWSTGEIANTISVNSPGHYWLMMTSPSGKCSMTDSIWVKNDCYLNVPNSFSPNDDGNNDYFLPRELLSSGLVGFKMTIFNRWGEEIFYTVKLNGRGWDGKFNGINQPMGVYVYMINAVFGNGLIKTINGNVTLMR